MRQLLNDMRWDVEGCGESTGLLDLRDWTSGDVSIGSGSSALEVASQS